MHKNVDMVRYWKDPEYRARMQEQGIEVDHPAGLIEVSDEKLAEASGMGGHIITTAITCTENTFLGWKACCP